MDETRHLLYSDEDLFPGCKFNEEFKLLSIFDPYSLESPLSFPTDTDPHESPPLLPETVSFADPSSMGSLNDGGEMQSNLSVWSTKATASLHGSQSMEQLLLDSEDPEKALSHESSVASFSSMGIPYPSVAKHHRAPPQLEPRLSFSLPKHATLSFLKSMSKPPRRSHAVRRWRAEKKALFVQARQKKLKKEMALNNLTESIENIFLSMKAKQELKKGKQKSRSLHQRHGKKDWLVPGLQAIKTLIEKKRRRMQEQIINADKKRVQKERNLIAIRNKLEKEFQTPSPPLPPTDPSKEAPYCRAKEKKRVHAATRLPSLQAQEVAKTKKALALAQSLLSKFPGEFQSQWQTTLKNLETTNKPLPLPIPKHVSTSFSPSMLTLDEIHKQTSSGLHPHLHVTPPVFTFTRTQPTLTVKFTNTSNQVLRVTILPLDLELEPFFTLSSTPSLSLAKGISLSAQVNLTLPSDTPLTDTTLYGLRLLVNGQKCVWPLSIQGDRFILECDPPTLTFVPDHATQHVVQVTNKGTVAGEVTVRSSTPMVAISQPTVCLRPSQRHRFTLVLLTTAPATPRKETNQDVRPSSERSCPLDNAAEQEQATVSFWLPDSDQPVLNVPVHVHLSPPPSFRLDPLTTTFAYCPATLQIKTVLRVHNQLRHGLRLATKTRVTPSPSAIEVVVTPDESVCQVGTPTELHVQLRCCRDPNKLPLCLPVTCAVTVMAKRTTATSMVKGVFFNPDFHVNVTSVTWPSMAVHETYVHPMALTNPTPVIMPVGMRCTCATAVIRGTPMASDTLFLAPNQTVALALHVTPFQPGKLHGEVAWQNVFGVTKTIQLHTHVFQPVCRFDPSEYTFPPVTDGAVSRHVLTLTWCMRDRARCGREDPAAHRCTYQFGRPTLVREHGARPTSGKLAPTASPAASPFRIHPVQGDVGAAETRAVHVAFTPPSRALATLPCTYVYRVPVLFTRPRGVATAQDPRRSVQYLRFTCTHVPEPFTVSAGGLVFGAVPVGYHATQSLVVTNTHPDAELAVAWTCHPHAPFALVSRVRRVAPGKSVVVVVGFYPTQLGDAVQTCFLTSAGHTCRVVCRGTGVEVVVRLENDVGCPWTPLAVEMGAVLLNEPVSVTRQLHNASGYAMKVVRGTSTPATSMVEWGCPEQVPALASVGMTWTCAATQHGWVAMQGHFFVLGLGYRSFVVSAMVQRYSAYCVGPPGTVQRVGAAGIAMVLPTGSPATLRLVHAKPAGVKVDAKKPATAHFACSEAWAVARGMAMVHLDMGKDCVMNLEVGEPFSLAITGAMDISTKKWVTQDAPIVYQVSWESTSLPPS